MHMYECLEVCACNHIQLGCLSDWRKSQRFTALLEYVQDHPGEQVPER